MKSILITGGAGFIGSHTSLFLLERGYSIFILDSCINSSEKVIEKISLILKKKKTSFEDKIQYIQGDLRSKEDIDNIFNLSIQLKKKIEAVIHFAGLKAVFDSVVDPLTYWDSNLIGTINLLKIMEKHNCRNIVFSSSATVYKAKSDNLLNEEDFCEPVNPYGNTKLTIEIILRDLYKSKPLEWRIAALRYFNPVGAHESGLIGEDPYGKPNNLYPQITRVAAGKQENIRIFGSDWPTIDGTGIRDYIHVMDLAEGHFLALNYLLNEKPKFLTLNLGTGKGTTVLELIKVFEKVNEVRIPYCFVDRRSGDNAFVVADNSLAKSILNWEPKRNIDDICRSGWNWQLKNPNGYK